MISSTLRPTSPVNPLAAAPIGLGYCTAPRRSRIQTRNAVIIEYIKPIFRHVRPFETKADSCCGRNTAASKSNSDTRIAAGDAARVTIYLLPGVICPTMDTASGTAPVAKAAKTAIFCAVLSTPQPFIPSSGGPVATTAKNTTARASRKAPAAVPVLVCRSEPPVFVLAALLMAQEHPDPRRVGASDDDSDHIRQRVQ